MSREIKYRGLCIAEGEFHGKWVYGDLIQRQGKAYMSPRANRVIVEGHIGKLIIMHEVDPDTVGQYTGQKDRDSEEIFDGELCREGDTVYQIVWRADVAQFGAKVVKSDHVLSQGLTFPLWQYIDEWTKRSRFTSIGNIYEHPHLLGEKGELQHE